MDQAVKVRAHFLHTSRIKNKVQSIQYFQRFQPQTIRLASPSRPHTVPIPKGLRYLNVTHRLKKRTLSLSGHRILFFKTVSHVEVTESHTNRDGRATLKGWLRAKRAKNAKSTVHLSLRFCHVTVTIGVLKRPTSLSVLLMLLPFYSYL